jgi:hypothetical protein
MNPASREIVVAITSADTTDPPPDPGRESADRTTSGRASSASGHAYVDARFASSSAPPPDYPPARAVWNREVLDWIEDAPLVENAVALGKRLAEAGDLFRASGYANGLILGSAFPNIPPTPIKDPALLAAVIADRQRVRVLKDGNIRGNAVPLKHLKTLIKSESFLQQFAPVDVVEPRSRYLPGFVLTRPGYNDGGFGQRILHIGEEPWIEPNHDCIARFLDAMAFATEADATNAVGAALTVLLRNFWPGGKPCLIVTSTKSHAGKETIVSFAAGLTRVASISYEQADWALQKAFVAAVKHEPEIGLVDVENTRLDRGQSEIASAFVERIITDPSPMLFSPGTGAPFRIRNEIIIAITTNDGTLSKDLMNRGLPIRLAPVGDVAARVSPLGNPRLEFLPRNRDRIEAEVRGMIENWKHADRPLDMRVRHPASEWAKTVGGILMVAGFSGFLANSTMRKTADDRVRRGLGLLGAARPGQWLRTADWARLTAALGLAKAILPEADRDSDLGRERGMGVVLSAHRDETFLVETEDRRMALRLVKARRRFDTGEEPSTRYRFDVLGEEEIPEDPPQPEGSP